MRLQSEVLMGEVQRFIDSGQHVILPVSGNSMLPFIVGDKDKVEFCPPPRVLQRGDVVMAKVDEGYYVVHRIVAIAGEQLTLEGDGNLGLQEHCHRSHVVAQGIAVVNRKGRRRSLTAPGARRLWRIWMRLGLFRRILLKVCRLMGSFRTATKHNEI